MSTSADSKSKPDYARHGNGVLDIIQQYAPQYAHWRTTSNPRSKYTGKCPLCQSDSRSGVNNYFTIHEN